MILAKLRRLAMWHRQQSLFQLKISFIHIYCWYRVRRIEYLVSVSDIRVTYVIKVRISFECLTILIAITNTKISAKNHFFFVHSKLLWWWDEVFILFFFRWFWNWNKFVQSTNRITQLNNHQIQMFCVVILIVIILKCMSWFPQLCL